MIRLERPGETMGASLLTGTWVSLKQSNKPITLREEAGAMKRAFALALMLVLAGCGTARALVLKPVITPSGFHRVELVESNPTVKVPAEVTARLRTLVEKGLYEKGTLARGPDLRILHTFVCHDPGSQFERWFWGASEVAFRPAKDNRNKVLREGEKWAREIMLFWPCSQS